jgi:ribonuclease P protein component
VVENRALFRAVQHLRASRQFQEIYGRGARAFASTLVLYGRLNQLGYHRLGITVSRKVGGAVVRNRIRRRIREVFRTKLLHNSAGIDIVVNAKRSIATASYLRIQQDFLEAFKQLSGQLSNAPAACARGDKPV